MFRQARKLKKLIEAFGTNRDLIDINETVKKHTEILPKLIDARVLSGCDSVPKLYGTGKKIVTKHLRDRNLSLSSLGDTATTLANAYDKNTKLISSYYGIKNTNNLSEVRFSVWGKRTGKKITSTPKLEFLPSTKKDFLLKVLRAHYQVCIWNSCLQPRPLKMDNVSQDLWK